jgi:aspartate ammonia-lyase
MAEMRCRRETDLLGAVEVPQQALFGGQTQRAVANFPLAGEKTIGSYPELVAALVAVKAAAARANARAGVLAPEIAGAIVAAAHAVSEQPPAAEFPVHRLHGGGGTSANMNANEVLANLAEERLGGRRGEYRRVHPNDHVNLNQSTNDVYPTACHVAIVTRWRASRAPVLDLATAFEGKAAETAGLPRLTRSCLQDAVGGTYGQLFGAYAALLRRAAERVDGAVASLHVVNLGGGIIGHRDDVPAGYFEAVIEELRATTGDEAYSQAIDLYAAAQSPDDMVAVSAQLDLLARGLVKIAKDLRLLGSGPDGGLGELRLPPVQPGSSAMPGKVNPVIPEFAIQLALEACGRHAACQAAIDHGELDLNVWESLVMFSVLDAMGLLANACATLAARCVVSLTVDAERSAAHARGTIPALAALARKRGYSAVSGLVEEAGGDLAKVRQALGNGERD